MIIAKKNLSLIALYLITALLCAATAIYLISLIYRGEATVYYIGMSVAFLLCFAVSVVIAVTVAKPPHIVITYEDGMLHFADGLQCAPHELERVNYRRASAKSIQYAWGTLIVYVRGQKHKYRFVASVVEVHDRLIELKLSTGGQHG